jgi:hypothetical protein
MDMSTTSEIPVKLMHIFYSVLIMTQADSDFSGMQTIRRKIENV